MKLQCCKQIGDLKLADSKVDYTTTWNIIPDQSEKDKKSSAKVKKRDGTPPTSDKDLLSELREYFSSWLNNSNVNLDRNCHFLLLRIFL